MLWNESYIGAMHLRDLQGSLENTLASPYPYRTSIASGLRAFIGAAELKPPPAPAWAECPDGCLRAFIGAAELKLRTAKRGASYRGSSLRAFIGAAELKRVDEGVHHTLNHVRLRAFIGAAELKRLRRKIPRTIPLGLRAFIGAAELKRPGLEFWSNLASFVSAPSSARPN